MLFCKYPQTLSGHGSHVFSVCWVQLARCLGLYNHTAGSLSKVLVKCHISSLWSNEMLVVTGESPVLPSYYTMGTFMVLEVLQNLLRLKDWLGRESDAHNHMLLMSHPSPIRFFTKVCIYFIGTIHVFVSWWSRVLGCFWEEKQLDYGA
jgi:hypothetical protein